MERGITHSMETSHSKTPFGFQTHTHTRRLCPEVSTDSRLSPGHAGCSSRRKARPSPSPPVAAGLGFAPVNEPPPITVPVPSLAWPLRGRAASVLTLWLPVELERAPSSLSGSSCPAAALACGWRRFGCSSLS